MADNTTITPGAGATVAADNIGDVLYQRVKLAIGADGEAADLDSGQAAMAASLPVAIASDQTDVPITLDGETVPISADALPLPSGAATSALQGGGLPAALGAGGGLKVEGVAGGEAVGVSLETALDDNNDMVAVGDGSGNALLTAAHPGIVQSTESAVDNTAFTAGTSRVVTGLAGIAQLSAAALTGILTTGRAGLARLTPRRAQVMAPDAITLQLTPTAPTPTGTDIVNASGGALVEGDLQIRDTNAHTFLIPMCVMMGAAAGIWSDVTILIWQESGTPLDQDLTITLSSDQTGGVGLSTLATFTFAGSAMRRIGIGSAAAGQGSGVGGASANDKDWYSVPALACPHYRLILTLKATVAPTSGKISSITIIRRA